MQVTCPGGRLAFRLDSPIGLGPLVPIGGRVSQEESTRGVSPRMILMKT